MTLYFIHLFLDLILFSVVSSSYNLFWAFFSSHFFLFIFFCLVFFERSFLFDIIFLNGHRFLLLFNKLLLLQILIARSLHVSFLNIIVFYLILGPWSLCRFRLCGILALWSRGYIMINWLSNWFLRIVIFSNRLIRRRFISLDFIDYFLLFLLLILILFKFWEFSFGILGSGFLRFLSAAWSTTTFNSFIYLL